MTASTTQLIELIERLSPEQQAEALKLLNALLAGTRITLADDVALPAEESQAFDPLKDISFDAPNLSALFNRTQGKRKRWEPEGMKGTFIMAPDFDEPLDDLKDYM